MRFDPNDETPIFASEEEALAEVGNPYISPEHNEVAHKAHTLMAQGFNAAELDAYETIITAQADDLKHESEDGVRLWLSRTGVADGEPFENTVTIEEEVDGRWVTVARYDGGELPDEDEEIACDCECAVALERLAEVYEDDGDVVKALRDVLVSAKLLSDEEVV